MGDCCACNIWHWYGSKDSGSGRSDAHFHVPLWSYPLWNDPGAHCQTLQQTKIFSVEGHKVAMLTVKTFQHLRSDDNFDLFCQKVEKMRYQLNICWTSASKKMKGTKAIWQVLQLSLQNPQTMNIARRILRLLALPWQESKTLMVSRPPLMSNSFYSRHAKGSILINLT